MYASQNGDFGRTADNRPAVPSANDDQQKWMVDGSSGNPTNLAALFFNDLTAALGAVLTEGQEELTNRAKAARLRDAIKNIADRQANLVLANNRVNQGSFADAEFSDRLPVVGDGANKQRGYKWIGKDAQGGNEWTWDGLAWVQTKGSILAYDRNTTGARGKRLAETGAAVFQYLRDKTNRTAASDLRWTDFSRLYFSIITQPVGVQTHQDQTSPVIILAKSFIAGEKVYAAEDVHTGVITYTGDSTFSLYSEGSQIILDKITGEF